MIDRSLNYGRHHIASFLEGIGPGKTVLDLGAGHGDDLEIARRTIRDAKLVAVECWPPYIKELESKGIAVLDLNIERDRLPYADGKVDVVIANQILEHTKEIFWIFHEVSRVLPVGGHFVIGVPNLASLHNRLLLSLGRQPTSIKSASAHVRGYTKPDLVHFVDSCFPGGYALDGFGGSNFYPFPPVVAKPLARLLPSMSWGIFLRFTKVSAYRGEFAAFPRNKNLETNFFLGERQREPATA